jgi:hypothetical protein
MKRRTTFVLIAMTLLGLAIAIPQAAFAESDPLLGTWQLNLAKSKHTPGPGPKSATENIQRKGENRKLTAFKYRRGGEF